MQPLFPSSDQGEVAPDATDGSRHAAIEKAKLEWESTVDALSAVVCLLDADGAVLRANRAVESWRLGTVAGVLGRPMHALLHPNCNDAACAMARALDAVRAQARTGEPAEFEHHFEPDDRTLQFTCRPMHHGDRKGRDRRIVLVVSDVTSLRRAQRDLQAANLDLEARVQLRTRELSGANRDLRGEVARREQAEAELRASRNDLALLSEQLIQAQEAERRRIALELHDSVGQSLSAIKYTLERAMIMLQRGNLGDPQPVLALAVRRIHETADGIRAISMNLRPPMLDSLGAASATTWFCRGFAEVYPALGVHTDITAKNTDIPARIATHLYRCLQELLNNAAKHAQAKAVFVVLKREGSRLSLEVRDDGIGMPEKVATPQALHGAGLRNLRERVELSGGEMSLASDLAGGTSARIVWCLQVDEFPTAS
jgi:signal transduction histidine kinase